VLVTGGRARPCPRHPAQRELTRITVIYAGAHRRRRHPDASGNRHLPGLAAHSPRAGKQASLRAGREW
jgi:hypothetical protein